MRIQLSKHNKIQAGINPPPAILYRKAAFMAAFLFLTNFISINGAKQLVLGSNNVIMKKLLFSLLLCTSLYAAQAQLLQLQDPVSSKNFNPEKYAGIRGTPFLQEKWIHGAVTTNLGIYNDLELKIDLFENALFYNNGGEPFELIDKIVEVKLFPKWPDNKIELVFTKGISQAGIKPEQYVQVLVGNGAVQFYRSDIKQVSEMSEINAGMVKTFSNTSRYYIKKGDQFKFIRLNKEDVMSFLMDKEAAINAIIAEKKLNLKKEGDIAQAIQAYNSLP
jgi:hypothetical protein